MDAVVVDHSATVVALDDCPAETQLRRVPKFTTDAQGEVLSSHLEDVPATYAWLLIVGETRVWLSADDSPLACLEAEDETDQGPVVGRLVGVNLPDGSLSYAHPTDPRHRCEVRQEALERMIAARLVPAALGK